MKVAGRATSLRVIPWHLSYNWEKSTGKTSGRVAEECRLARWKQNIQNRAYITIRIHKQSKYITYKIKQKHTKNKYIQGVQVKSGPILIWVIYLMRFTTCYITQLICIYSKCWKWCPFISMHLLTRFTMFLGTFLSVLSFFNNFRNSTFCWHLPSKFFKETLSTVGVRHRF